MEAYAVFSAIYDEFMDNIPYEKWGDYITDILKSHGISGGLVCDLGCGTGRMTRYMADKGYDMIGVDISEEMLLCAREQEESAGRILYLNQDMCELELYGTVGAVISVCDSMNYILDADDFCTVLRKVNNYLEKDGLFIFDVKTPYFYSNVLADSVQVDNREDATLIWENDYDAETGINAYELTMFLADCDTPDIYEKYTEYHEQRAYGIDEIKEMIKDSGMELVGVYDECTFNEPGEHSERVYFVVRETYQEGKYYE